MKKDYKLGQLFGNCPVQADGTLKDGNIFYFRSRWDRWKFNVSPPGGDVYLSPRWSYGEMYGTELGEAGWLSRKEAITFIEKSVRKYFEENPCP